MSEPTRSELEKIAETRRLLDRLEQAVHEGDVAGANRHAEVASDTIAQFDARDAIREVESGEIQMLLCDLLPNPVYRRRIIVFLNDWVSRDEPV